MITKITGGKIVLEDRVMDGDLWIDDSVITAITAPGVNRDEVPDQVIDVTGKLVLPGGIDAHTHFNLDVGCITTDDFTTGTIAAAYGGNTSIVDHMGFGPKGCDLHHQLAVYHGFADGKCVTDYGFHGVIQEVTPKILNEFESMIQDGVPSFKIYLTYNYKIEDQGALEVLVRMKELGGVMAVHCENDTAINYLREKYVSEGKLSPEYHALSRPENCENEAVLRMIALSDAADRAPLYIVHISSAESARIVKDALAAGTNVYGETCPQYLFLDESVYQLPEHEGLKYIMSPPLRSKDNQEKLWGYIKDGTIKVIATDHCDFDFYGDKQRGKDNFTLCPNGAPGVETRIPLVFSEGVSKGRISLNEFANVISTNPAKIFGMYPLKGVLAPGSDADIVIIDPELDVRITKDMLHENVDYTPYEGFEVKGWPVMTMIRGRVVTEGEELKVQPGYGQFLSRKASK